MEEQQEDQPGFKYFCRVCKKGFVCGRALGGHMRAHGIIDENIPVDEDDEDRATEWDGEEGTRRMYQLRTNPNRLKSCKNCGKEFLSWKSFLEHGKCNSDDASESFISLAESDGDEEDGDGAPRGSGLFRRKRSLRSSIGCVDASYLAIEDDDILLARCLVELANTVVHSTPVEPEESCASASREDERRNPNLLTGGMFDYKGKGVSISSPKGVFECKACNKVFNSHQALGGHRASHKKFKGCFATKTEETHSLIAEDEAILNEELAPSRQFLRNNDDTGTHSTKKKTKIHGCSICHRVFPSGQALGGHKRCHWIRSNAPATPSIPPKFHLSNNSIDPGIPPKLTLEMSHRLDLNVSAWAHFSAVQRTPNNLLSFEVPTDIHLRAGGDVNNETENENKNSNRMAPAREENNGGMRVEDEADSKMKMGKVTDLKEMSKNGESSQWLQVGIGSTTQPGTAAAAAACDL